MGPGGSHDGEYWSHHPHQSGLLAERLRQRATDALEEAARRGHDRVWFSTDPQQVA